MHRRFGFQASFERHNGRERSSDIRQYHTTPRTRTDSLAATCSPHKSTPHQSTENEGEMSSVFNTKQRLAITNEAVSHLNAVGDVKIADLRAVVGLTQCQPVTIGVFCSHDHSHNYRLLDCADYGLTLRACADVVELLHHGIHIEDSCSKQISKSTPIFHPCEKRALCYNKASFVMTEASHTPTKRSVGTTPLWRVDTLM